MEPLWGYAPDRATRHKLLALRGAGGVAFGLYAGLNRPTGAREIHDVKLVTAIDTRFTASDRTYGARRVWRDVLEEGLT
jgi:hypothetical protein